MDKSFVSEKFKLLLPYFLLALAIIVAYRISGEIEFFVNFARQAWRVVSPFFYGFVLAYIINLPISSIQRILATSKNKFILKRQRMFSALIVLILVLIIIALSLNLIIPAIADSVSFFIANIPVYWESVVHLIDYFNNLELFGWHISAEGIFTLLGDTFGNFSFEGLLAPINAIMSAATAVFSGAITLISSIYILAEKDKFKAFINKMLMVFTPNWFNTAVIWIMGGLNKNFRQYIHTQTIDGIILGTLATIVLSVLGSPYALILGIILGIVNYIPYFGSIFGTAAAVIVVAFTQGITMGAISAGSLFIIQQIDANIIQPRLMSGSFSLSPLLVIISITIGGAIAGVLGMLVAIPIIAVLKDIFDSILVYYERKKFGKSDDQENDK